MSEAEAKEEAKLLWSNAGWELLETKERFELRKKDSSEGFTFSKADIVYIAPLIVLAKEAIE